MISAWAKDLSNKEVINDSMFSQPDGDTGTNMGYNDAACVALKDKNFESVRLRRNRGFAVLRAQRQPSHTFAHVQRYFEGLRGLVLRCKV